ncbi:hypothetical protein MUN77_01445 [Leucobacter allii]|uniref:hypothetical protein n=1 Tax=Leucobacter allii TaxID=2932247 RepID=UPI001FD2D920|nr:hypothetical protein [Leucobacter allii]UOR02023.1 hypothetical protein MUN77_01445 [Leucobacter allii]
MSDMRGQEVGHINGKILFQLGDCEPVRIGYVPIPLKVTKGGTSGVNVLEIGADVSEIADTIRAIFGQQNKEAE